MENIARVGVCWCDPPSLFLVFPPFFLITWFIRSWTKRWMGGWGCSGSRQRCGSAAGNTSYASQAGKDLAAQEQARCRIQGIYACLSEASSYCNIMCSHAGAGPSAPLHTDARNTLPWKRQRVEERCRQLPAKHFMPRDKGKWALDIFKCWS